MSEADALALLNQISHETSEGQSPLRDFYGRLLRIDMYESPQTDDDGSQRMSFRLKYMFDQVRVIHSVTPWQYDTADLSWFVNKPGEAPQPTNRTGILFDSVAEILGKQTKPPDTYGKMYHIKWLEGHPMKRRIAATGAFEDYMGAAYRAVDIDGIVSPTPWIEPVGESGATPEQVVAAPVAVVPGVPATPAAVPVPTINIDTHLVALATGKNHPSTATTWISDPTVTADAVLYGQIVADNGASVANRLMTEGKMVNVDGIYGPVV